MISLRLAAVLGAAAVAVGCSKDRPRATEFECIRDWPAAATASVKPSLSVTPRVIWEGRLGGGALSLPRVGSGVVVLGDQVFATAGPGLFALDRNTGTQMLAVMPGEPTHALGAPASDGGDTLYVSSASTLHAYSAAGAKRWSASIPGFRDDPEGVTSNGAPSMISPSVVTVGGMDGKIHAFDAAGGTLLWSSERGRMRGIGHYTFGRVSLSSLASYLVDLRTRAIVGELRDAAGRDMLVLALLGGHGVVGYRPGPDRTLFTLLDTCGKQVWQLDMPEPHLDVDWTCAISGLGDVLYVRTTSYSDASRTTVTRPTSIVGISPDGRVVSGPVSRPERPLVSAADGTLYVFGPNGWTTRIAALGPALEERWHLDVQWSTLYVFAAAALADDGILYIEGGGVDGTSIIAIQTDSPGLAASSWPSFRHDNWGRNWHEGTP